MFKSALWGRCVVGKACRFAHSAEACGWVSGHMWLFFFTKGIRNCHTCQSEDSACVFFFVHPCLVKEVLFAFVCPHSWHHYCTIRLGLVGAFTVICRCSMEVTVEIYDDLWTNNYIYIIYIDERLYNVYIYIYDIYIYTICIYVYYKLICVLLYTVRAIRLMVN